MTYPKRRTAECAVQVVADETLIYDERRHEAFCLNQIASAVWRLSDGESSVTNIALAASLELGQPLTSDEVEIILAQLAEDELLEGDTKASDGRTSAALAATMSRRQMVGRLGAGAAMMVPVVASIMAPKAAQAYTGCVDCTPNRGAGRRSPSPTQ